MLVILLKSWVIQIWLLLKSHVLRVRGESSVVNIAYGNAPLFIRVTVASSIPEILLYDALLAIELTDWRLLRIWRLLSPLKAINVTPPLPTSNLLAMWRSYGFLVNRVENLTNIEAHIVPLRIHHHDLAP